MTTGAEVFAIAAMTTDASTISIAGTMEADVTVRKATRPALATSTDTKAGAMTTMAAAEIAEADIMIATRSVAMSTRTAMILHVSRTAAIETMDVMIAMAADDRCLLP